MIGPTSLMPNTSQYLKQDLCHLRQCSTTQIAQPISL